MYVPIGLGAGFAQGVEKAHPMILVSDKNGSR
jgi:hypothetical protein